MKNTFFDTVFRDSNGRIVVAEAPNPPLIVWVAASLLQLVFTTGTWNRVFDALAFGSLFTWAWLELFQGMNYFRRALGLTVLIGVLLSRTVGIDALTSFVP